MIELIERNCAHPTCNCKYKVMVDDRQKYCSTNCMIRDNKLLGKDKIQFKKWKRLNPDKIMRKK